MSVELVFDTKKVVEKLDKFKDLATLNVSQQVQTDSNIYVRFDKGTLARSTELASDLAHGQVVWDTPYAKRVYYVGTPNTEANPNASLMWFEVAKSRFSKDWLTLAKKSLEEVLK